VGGVSRVTIAWIVIAVVGIGTYLVRASFLAVADQVAAVPERWRTPLRLIPPAVLAALVAPAVLRPGGELTLLGPRAFAGLIALAVAVWTRNILATILVGLAAAIGLELLFG
jgi:branched-subunit amino acid transport protein